MYIYIYIYIERERDTSIGKVQPRLNNAPCFWHVCIICMKHYLGIPLGCLNLRVFEFLLNYCSQNGIGICWNMSKNIQNGSLKEAKLSKIPLWGPLRGPHWGVLDSFGFFGAAMLYIFGHIPTNAYAILAATFKQEFKDPKIKHTNWIPERKGRTVQTHDVSMNNFALCVYLTLFCIMK